ncbi:serine/threonine-protein kinase [Nocardia amikacinitolerans]|uniref:serine/threonine-protein kinase n=1 Tax=Nocardia amikacinitolerans TaxID=756689 RepID=UPI0020A59230|nr:serine/threonine protein kinase [Nocardia amikacinitolerans]MCP2275503.1 Serine/threonine protein kinase [Nocardia amikacinitolerans]
MFDHSKGTDFAMQPLGMDDPRRIGDYRLLGVLGAGGMGRVYLGRNVGGRTVAVKVIRPDLAGGNEFRTRFRREVMAARRVGGRFTAPVLDADVDADPPWLATGYVAGFALSEAVERFGTFTEPTLLVLARGLAEALIAVHEAGVVHRDLKPSNVLLAVDGPKVIDFGIARAVEDTALTTTGKVIGSPGFMCPEQVTGETVGPASDVFALGGVLAFAAAGHGPFGTGETMHMLWRIVYEDPQLDAVPDRLRPLVASCLAKDPVARPTPRQLLDELAALGVPERAGWLPPPVLEEVSVRAVRLLDLDSGPVELDGWSQTARSLEGGHPVTPPSGYPTRAGHADTSTPRQQGFTPSGGSSAAPARWQHPETPAPQWQPMDSSPARPTAAPSAHSAPNIPGAHAGSHQAWQHAASRPGPTTGQNGAPDRLYPVANSAGGRVRRRGPLLAGLLVVCVVVAIGAFVIGSQLRGASGTGGGGTSTVAGGSTEAVASVSNVPEAFVGTWRGTGADGLVTFDIELTVREGKVGEEVATSANTGKVSRQRCGRIERLTAATENQLTFIARLSADSPTDCADGGSTSTVRLQADGSLSYSTPGVFGGTIAGTLHKG